MISRAERGRARYLAAVGGALLAVAVAGCGGDDDDGTPGYCSQVSKLQQSVKDLGNVDVIAGGTNALKKSLQSVESNAKATVEAAKNDFPSETSAVDDSISALQESATSLSGSPSAGQAAQVATDAKAVVTSVQDLAAATQSACN